METMTLAGQKEGETLEEAVDRLLALGKEVPMPHLSKEGIEALYSFAFGSYESGNYEKAMHFFRFLTLVDINGRKHWMGLGASYQMLKQYERALQCYGYAAILNENDPLAHWHAAECFLSLDNPEKALEALNSASITAKRQPKKYRTLIERIKLMRCSNAN